MSQTEMDTLRAAGEGHRPSLLYWSDLLNFYIAHRDQLEDAQILNLYRRSEECRRYWNVDRVEVTRVKRADGTVRETISLRRGLNCRREEVASDLYAVADRILRESRQERAYARALQPHGEASLHCPAMGHRA
jgi:hypothetical protein